MVKWLEQASQWLEMYCHDLDAMSSNPAQAELGVRSTSVLSRTWTKHNMRWIAWLDQFKIHVLWYALMRTPKATDVANVSQVCSQKVMIMSWNSTICQVTLVNYEWKPVACAFHPECLYTRALISCITIPEGSDFISLLQLRLAKLPSQCHSNGLSNLDNLGSNKGVSVTSSAPTRIVTWYTNMHLLHICYHWVQCWSHYRISCPSTPPLYIIQWFSDKGEYNKGKVELVLWHRPVSYVRGWAPRIDI